MFCKIVVHMDESMMWLIPAAAMLFFFIVFIFVFSKMAGLYKTVAAGRGDIEGRDILAESIGFNYSEYPLEDYVGLFKDFELFQAGFEKQPYNFIEGKWDGIHWKIFDYKYKEATGKYGSDSYCTVMYADLEEQGVNFPYFYMAKEYIWHRVGNMLGKDINFDSHPKFSKKYFLKSPMEEDKVREWFTPKLMNFFENVDWEITIEAQHERIIFYTYPNPLNQTIIKPNQLKQCIESATAIVKALIAR